MVLEVILCCSAAIFLGQVMPVGEIAVCKFNKRPNTQYDDVTESSNFQRHWVWCRLKPRPSQSQLYRLPRYAIDSALGL